MSEFKNFVGLEISTHEEAGSIGRIGTVFVVNGSIEKKGYSWREAFLGRMPQIDTMDYEVVMVGLNDSSRLKQHLTNRLRTHPELGIGVIMMDMSKDEYIEISGEIGEIGLQDRVVVMANENELSDLRLNDQLRMEVRNIIAKPSMKNTATSSDVPWLIVQSEISNLLRPSVFRIGTDENVARLVKLMSLMPEEMGSVGVLKTDDFGGYQAKRFLEMLRRNNAYLPVWDIHNQDLFGSLYEKLQEIKRKFTVICFDDDFRFHENADRIVMVGELSEPEGMRIAKTMGLVALPGKENNLHPLT